MTILGYIYNNESGEYNMVKSILTFISIFCIFTILTLILTITVDNIVLNIYIKLKDL